MLNVMRWSAAGSASLTVLSFKVYAVGKKKKDDSSLVRADDLSLYSVPNLESRFVEEPRSSLEEAISRLRTAMAPHVSWFQALYSKTKPTVDGAIQQGSASCDYLRNSPPEVVKRFSLIVFSGFLGYFLADTSKSKRLLYPFGLMGITSSIYYPQEAFNLVLICGEKLYNWGLAVLVMGHDAWKTCFQEDNNTKKPEEGKYLFKRKKK